MALKRPLPIEDILDDPKLRVVKVQHEVVGAGNFYLAGGTGLALRLRHRSSADLDWFSPAPFSTDDLAADLLKQAVPPSRIQVDGRNTVRAYYESLETSFITFKTPPGSEACRVRGQTIPVATVEHVATMKAGAVYNRGSRRDLVDVHAICQQPGWSVPRFVDLAKTKVGIDPLEMVRALSYFADAEKQPMPSPCVYTWEEVKRTLSRGVQMWRNRTDPEVER